MRFEPTGLVGRLANSHLRVPRGQNALLFAGILLQVAFLWGCSGLVAQNSPPPPQTYNVSGTISPAAGGNAATVALSGSANATTTANSSGNFTFSGLANGTYTITPSRPGFTFSPSSATVTINGANVTSGANFTATAQTFGISGTISPTAGGSGTTVTLSGAANATATADSSGSYSFSGLANGTYTVTPSHAGHTFSPATQTATVNGANVAGLNFTATAVPTFSISGTISPTAGGTGATVTLSGVAAATTITDAAGNYTFTALANGTYTVTPSHAGYTFSPAIQAVTVNGANVTAINFTAIVTPTFSVSGTISPTTGGSGAMVTLSGAAAATTTTSSSGNFSFTGLLNGTYLVIPSNTGFSFTPASQSVTINAANVTGVNFTATVLVAHSVDLTWVASITPGVSAYNVYRSTMTGTGYTRINSSPVGALIYTDTTVQNVTTYYYVTTAVDSTGVESGYSNEVAAVIP